MLHCWVIITFDRLGLVKLAEGALFTEIMHGKVPETSNTNQLLPVKVL
jgi:hypothetical protein